MKLLQRLTVAVFILVLAAYAGLNFYTYRYVDRTPPIITCGSDVVEVRVGAPDSELLRDVTAHDDVDGDISDQIMIKGVSQLITADTAKITYLVMDSSNNMTTASRTVRYTNYEKPRFELTTPLIYSLSSNIRLLDRLRASDRVDGDISHNIRVTTQNVDPSRSGVYSVTVQVSNSLGDVETLPLRLLLTDGLRPAVTLTKYVEYISAGASFAPERYIASPADRSGVEISSNVDTSTPGVYEVSYTHSTGTVYLAVVVR